MYERRNFFKHAMGISSGCANNALYKMILFKLVEMNHDDVCGVCGEKIVDSNSYMVSRKNFWLTDTNPKESFFDPENVSFNHSWCRTQYDVPFKREKGIRRRLLGMNHSTARQRYFKILMFHYVKLLKLDDCFQCGKPITNIKDFTVEHKISWYTSDNPVKFFFDMDNIAFSHHLCNSTGSNKKMTKKGKQARIKSAQTITANKKRNRRFSDDEIREIRNSFISHDKQFGRTALSRKHGVSIDAINGILRRRYYKDVK